MALTALQRLEIHFASIEAIPKGTKNGLAAGFRFLTDAVARKEIIERARVKMNAAIHLVRSAPDNPYKTDEEIAAAILARVPKSASQKLRDKLGGSLDGDGVQAAVNATAQHGAEQ